MRQILFTCLVAVRIICSTLCLMRYGYSVIPFLQSTTTLTGRLEIPEDEVPHCRRGPAGMMLGFFLGQPVHDVVGLEKHAGFPGAANLEGIDYAFAVCEVQWWSPVFCSNFFCAAITLSRCSS